MKRNIFYYRSALLILAFFLIFSNAAPVSAGKKEYDVTILIHMLGIRE